MTTPSINQGQIAIDPVNGILYYKTRANALVQTSLNLLQESNVLISTSDSLEVGGSLFVEGDFTVTGNTVTINTETLLIEDNIIVLNSNVTGTPTVNAGIEINRGNVANVQIIWNETTNKWQFTNDGVNYYDIGSVETASINDLADVILSNSADGDFLRYNGNVWINDPVDLATDTVGDYVQSLVSGTGISLSNNSGKGSTPTIAIGQDVSINANVSFDIVTADFIGNLTGLVSSISNHNINDLGDVVVTSAQNGQLLEFDGTNWVNAVRPSSEPIGHEDKTDSTISFNEGTRTFSIAPVSTSYTVWCAGKRFVKTATETVQIPDTSGIYYIYFNSSGTLSYRVDYFVWDTDTPTAYVYWNATDDKAYFFADERHGITLDWATHEYLHRTRGAVIANGFGVNNFVTNGDGSSDAHAKFDLANGTFFDEDLQVDITHSNTPTANTWEQVLQGNAEIPVFYKVNTHWVKDTATEFAFKQGTSLPQYNSYSAPNWSTSDIVDNKYAISWIIATNNLNEPVIAIMGQASYNNIGAAEAAKWEDLNLDGLPIVEFRPLHKAVYQGLIGYTNSVNAAIRGIYDLRRVTSSGGSVPSTPVSDHGSMTGLSDDDHPQYLLVENHDTRDHSNALSTASIDDLSDVALSNSANGDFLRYNGSVWINDPVNLSTDTIGDYVKNIIAGDAIEIDVLSGEGATPTISILDDSITSAKLSPTFEYVDRVYAGNNIILSDDTGLGVVSPSIEVSASPSFEAVTTNELTIGAIEIDPFGAAVDEVLKFNGVKFIPGIASTVAALDDLTDVNAATPSTGDFLYWDGSEWIPSVPATGMPAVSDTVPLSPVIGQLWFKSDSAQTFIYYDNYWIEIGSVAPSETFVSKYVEVIGNGSNSYIVSHNLDTRNVLVEIYDTNTLETVTASVIRNNTNAITASFAGPVSTNAYTIVIIG